MSSVPWWLPLLELSQVALRPGPETSGNQGETPETIGLILKADRVRFWEIAGRRKPQAASQWRRTVDGSSSEATELSVGSVDIEPELTKLIQMAVTQGKPMWVEASRERLGSIGTGSSGASSRSVEAASKVRLLAARSTTPKLHSVLEVELRVDPNSLLSSDRELYLQALHRLVKAVPTEDFAASRTIQSTEPIPLPLQINSLHRILDAQRARTIRLLEREISKLEGTQLGSFQGNQALAAKVHQLLDSAGLRVRCPHCGQPAILRCLAAGNTATGSFVFDHYLEEGRTFHGGRTTFPRLFLVAKPPRKLVTKND